jgi:DNA-binding response OmpR family regulator
MARLLFLEDDTLLGETLEEDLTEAGHNVVWVKDSNSAIDVCYENKFDLYLFDVNVPGMSGFELLAELQKSGDETPAIFLTARSSLDDLQMGFNSGAVDYITKPFDFNVLLIRIAAKLPQIGVRFGANITLDCDAETLTCGNKTQIIPHKELQILHYFIKHHDRVVSKDEIVDTLYDGEYISDATFRVYIKNIKKHVTPYAELLNTRGIGYRITLL